jgi:hypothetical protein
MKLGAVLIVIGCGGFGCSHQAATQPGVHDESAAQPRRAPEPRPAMVAAVQPAQPTPAGATPTRATRDQPPHIKLRLGHYRNDQLGIGVTIDLTEITENVADIDPAKLRFDGDPRVWRLQGQHGSLGRFDYLDGKRVLLHVWDNGRRAVYVPDPDTGKLSDEIYVRRDGDADPL